MKIKPTQVVRTVESAWDAISDTREEAATMKLRVNEMLHGKTAEFSLDKLEALRADIVQGLSDQAGGRTAVLDIAAIKTEGRRVLVRGKSNDCA